jgi:hypothetical protein
MWIITGKTLAGQDVSLKVAGSKGYDKGNVIGLAFAAHAQTSPTDPLDYPTLKTEWAFDNVQSIPELTLKSTSNYQVQKRVAKGVWERHSERAFRTEESAKEALEGAASTSPDDKFRIVRTLSITSVVAVSTNAVGAVDEKPDPVAKEEKPKPAPKTTKA